MTTVRALQGAVLALLVAACNPTYPGPPAAQPEPTPVEPVDPPNPRPVDSCDELPPLKLTVTPTQLHVSSPATLSASGGSGSYTFGVEAGGSGGDVQGTRFNAGATPGKDTLFVVDRVCGDRSVATAEVVAAFEVHPSRAVLKPAASLTLSIKGTVGAPVVAFATNASGGKLELSNPSAPKYTAGATAGVDLLDVRDPSTGEQVQVVLTVSAVAKFRATTPKLALPAPGSIALETTDGSGEVDFTVTGAGTVQGNLLTFEEKDAGKTATITATDRFTGEKATFSARALQELMRPTQAWGRSTDFGTLATGDFDGDGVADVALGMPDSDLVRASGGAVFIFKGDRKTPGLPPKPTWVITGETDTAQLGAAMVAGDFDGDGKADLAISSPGADITGTDSGAVYLYRFDPTAGPTLIRNPLTGLPRAQFGGSLAVADVDKDGQLDLVVGSPGGDLANTSTLKTRGIIDVFLMKKGQPIPDTGTLRLSGVDVATDGTALVKAGTAAGKGVVAADLNGDGRVDLAYLETVTSFGGTVTTKPAVAVHLARAGSDRFEDKPDAVIAPFDSGDTSEGTYRLGYVPKEGSGPGPFLAITVDNADYFEASTRTSNHGAAHLYDLTALPATGAAPAKPVQLDRSESFARLYGDTAGVVAGRSFAVTDLNGAQSVLLGAPFANGLDAANKSVKFAGKVFAWTVASLKKGTVSKVPDQSLAGANPSDCTGAALQVWKPSDSALPLLVTLSSRASHQSTGPSDPDTNYTGRLDATAGFDAMTRSSADVPAKPGQEQYGVRVAVEKSGNGHVFAAVGAPFTYRPTVGKEGAERSGLVWGFDLGAPPVQAVALATGNSSPIVRGGRDLGTDVTFTDFDGDGREDLVIGAPNLQAPGANVRSTEITGKFAKEIAACVPATSVTLGGMLVQLAQADGTYKDAFRIWAPQTIPNCTAPATCTRSSLGRSLIGGFDFNGDGKEDLATSRTNGLDIFLGRAPDDATLALPTMACDSALALSLPGAVTALGNLGDLNGDGCDELAFRYATTPRFGVAIVFGFDTGGTRCGGRTSATVVRLSADAEIAPALTFGAYGVSAARVGKVLGDTRDFVAVGATTINVAGVAQPAVLLYSTAELSALRPASGEKVVLATGDTGLTPLYVLSASKQPLFGTAVAGNVDVTGDGKVDLIVGAPGATESSDGGGAVYVFPGGPKLVGADGTGTPEPWLMTVGELVERSSFGQSLSVVKPNTAPATLVIGAPKSFRTGTQNGTAYALPLGF